MLGYRLCMVFCELRRKSVADNSCRRIPCLTCVEGVGLRKSLQESGFTKGDSTVLLRMNKTPF